MRDLDLRTDEEKRRDRLQRVAGQRMCRKYPGCECRFHGRAWQCEEKFGVFYDAAS